jgi:beta-lactamase regulating signal transducer with metallopeptidase domain
MQIIYQTLLANAISATVLAIVIAAITKIVRHPPLAHFLWLVVLLKLITPPLWSVEVPISHGTLAGAQPVTPNRPSAATRAGSTVAGSTVAGSAAAGSTLVVSSATGRKSVLPKEPAGTAAPPATDFRPANSGQEWTNAERNGGLREVSTLQLPPVQLPSVQLPPVQLPPVDLNLPSRAEIGHESDTLTSRAASPGSAVPLPQAPEMPDRRTTAVVPAAPGESPLSWGSVLGSRTWLAFRHLLSFAAWAWLAGSLLWFAVGILRVVRFERCRRQAELAPEPLQSESRRIARQLGLARCPAVCMVEGQLPPLLWAMTGKPTILLPAALLEQMPASRQALVVAHEMAHLARRDHWLRWFEFVVLGIYWWFPVAWWARREVHRAAEECCDAWVVWLFPGGARSYARSLLETIDFLSRARPVSPVGASSLGQFHFFALQRRFRMIKSGSITRIMPWPMRIMAFLLGVAILSFSARGVWGQATDAKNPPKPDTAANQPPPAGGGNTASAGPTAGAPQPPAGAIDKLPEARTVAAGTAPTAGDPKPPEPANNTDGPSTATPPGTPLSGSGIVPVPGPAGPPVNTDGPSTATPPGIPHVGPGNAPVPSGTPLMPGGPALPQATVGPPSNTIPPGFHVRVWPGQANSLRPMALQPATAQNPAADPLTPAAAPPGYGLPSTPAGVPPGYSVPTSAPPSSSPAGMPSNQDNVEARLQRLETATNQILQELMSLKSQSLPASPDSDPRKDRELLNSLDNEIKGLAANMQAMQERMRRLQAARARLVSPEPGNDVPNPGSMPARIEPPNPRAEPTP